MGGIIALIALIAIYAIVFFWLRNKLSPGDSASYRPEGPRGDDARLGRVAGITYHCTGEDCGGFVGRLRWDDGNAHDCNAVAVEAYPSGRLLGFVPREEAREWRQWAGAPSVPVIGYIALSEETGQIYARFKAFTGSRGYVRRGMADYAAWLRANFGPDYVPDGLQGIC